MWQGTVIGLCTSSYPEIAGLLSALVLSVRTLVHKADVNCTYADISCAQAHPKDPEEGNPPVQTSALCPIAAVQSRY